jgi:hypothetical protein
MMMTEEGERKLGVKIGFENSLPVKTGYKVGCENWHSLSVERLCEVAVKTGCEGAVRIGCRHRYRAVINGCYTIRP